MAVDEVVAERITIPPSVAVATDTSLYTREAFGRQSAARNVVEIGESVWYNQFNEF